MITQNQDGADDANIGGEGEDESVETIAIPKKDYETLNQTLGSLKREIKDLKKSKDEPKETPKETKSDDKLLERLDKMALQVAGIKEADEVELFNKWKSETGRGADAIIENDIFKKERESIRTAKANQVATSNIQGGGDKSGVKDNPDYWIAKATKGKDGKLEFPEETPKHLYSKILDKVSANEPGSSEKLKFYNG